MDIFRRSLPYKLVAADAANGRLAHAYLLVCPDEKNLRPFLKQLAKLVLRADARADRLIDAERYVDCRIFPAPGQRAGVEQVKDSAQKKTSQVRETLEEKKEAWDEKSAARRAEAKARIDEIVKKMPKRLLKAFPSLSSRRNPDSVPLVRESMEKGKDGAARAAATERPVQQEGEEGNRSSQGGASDEE